MMIIPSAMGGHTSQKLCCGFFVYKPLLRADGGFQGRIERLEVNSGWYDLARLDSLLGARRRERERLCR